MAAIRISSAQLTGILARGYCRLNTSAAMQSCSNGNATRQKRGSLPQDILWSAVQKRSGERAKAEYVAVPGRRFRIDIAFPKEKLAIEVDGWQYHGKHKGDFKKGLQRQNILTEHGWSFLRFTAGEIHNELEHCLGTIERSVSC